jgi:ABC-type transport system involved in cytochrome c biogenesis permease subunit
MHDIEMLIAEWRRSLGGELGKDAVDELEDHLREKIADFRERGIEAERAFKLAKFELGPGESIAAEYQKLETGMWWPMGIAMIAVCVCGVLSFGWVMRGALSGVFDPILAAHIFVIVTGYFTALMCGAIGGVFVLQRSFVEIPPQKSEKIARQTAGLYVAVGLLTAFGIIFGAIWSDAVLHSYWQWDLKETGGACVLLWAIFVVAMARSGKASARVVMMLGIFGNIVVSFAWLGPSVFSNSYDPFRRAQFYALLLMHVLLLVIGSLPAKWTRSLRAVADGLRR